METTENQLDSKDLKKLSKGQLKKLKEKAKKEGKGDVDVEEEETANAEAPANDKPAEASHNGADEPENDTKDEGTKGLSKGQLKKLKEKAKKEGTQPAPAQEAKVEEKKEEEEADDKKGKKGAKKPMNAAAKLAQQRLEEKKKLEEEQRKIEEEFRRKEEEERRQQEEEERRIKEEEERKRREKEEKIKKLKDEGVYKSKKEREREAALIRRREELIAQGLISADQFEDHGEKPKSKAVRTKKPKQKKETTENQADTQDADKEEKDENQEETEKKEVEHATWEDEFESTKETVKKPDLEDWEVIDQADAKKPTKDKASKTEDKVTDKPKDKASKPEKEAPKTEDKPKKVEEKATTKEAPAKQEDKKAEATVKEDIKKDDKKVEAAPKEEAKSSDKGGEKKNKEKKAEESKKATDNTELRSPIVCILGHVDTGKTSLLDKMRNTNVQEGEAGGITQQIGATFFPREKLYEEIEKCRSCYPVDLHVPGLLVIDTPGHESFSNLRSRGSGLCDIAILVVDIMHGLEKQTLESIELLRFRKTPFVIALNKIDRIYGWKPHHNTSSYLSLKKQDKNAQLEFRDRSKGIITELTEKGFNVALYYDNPDPNTYVSLIPTSAVTGEGIPDLNAVAVNLTQKWLKKKISVKDDFKCTVLEVKVIEGLGASIDVMLVDGTLHEGDKIILAGYDGVIVTQVRALLTPHPMKEMRVKNEYIHHKSIRGAMGIKISGNDLDKALAGSEVYVIRKEGDEELYRDQLEEEIRKVKKSIKLVDEGVLVASSTLGSLEALLQFLKTSKIPVSNISIGPISKAEVIKAMKPLQIVEGEKKIEFATILAFDVKVFPDAKDLAEQEGVKIFTANIIYHLFDQFTAYLRDLQEERKRNEGKLAVFPAILKPVAFFNMKDPIVMGIDVVEGQLRLGTPICVVEKGKLKIGAIESMEKEHKPLQVARPSDGSIAIKLKGDTTIMAGRHFELKDRLVSIISRESIDALKKYFRDEMSKSDWELIKKMKPLFGVI